MKLNILLIVLLLFIACNKEDGKISLSFSGDNSYNLDSDEHLLRIGVQSVLPWQVIGDTTWCQVVEMEQEADSLFIRVSVNLLEEGRNRVLQITNTEESKEILICQAGATKEYHYRLPVIFHILSYYQIVVDKELEDRLLYALGKANEIYQGNNGKSMDMNMEFFPVTHAPNGYVLDRPGINWRAHRWDDLDYQGFIDNEYGDAVWMWDPNKYINIYVFNFSRRTTYGATALSYTPANHPLEGLASYDLYFKEIPDDYIPCVMLNRRTFNNIEETPVGKQDRGVTTLIHELGHYFGLYHAFSRGNKIETDYCEDTPDYDRLAYGGWLMDHPEATWYEKAQRTGRDGNIFVSTNIMDYAEGYMEQFTLDQRYRVRHVLTYSPLVPGPKITVELDLDYKSDKIKHRTIID